MEVRRPRTLGESEFCEAGMADSCATPLMDNDRDAMVTPGDDNIPPFRLARRDQAEDENRRQGANEARPGISDANVLAIASSSILEIQQQQDRSKRVEATEIEMGLKLSSRKAHSLAATYFFLCSKQHYKASRDSPSSFPFALHVSVPAPC